MEMDGEEENMDMLEAVWALSGPNRDEERRGPSRQDPPGDPRTHNGDASSRGQDRRTVDLTGKFEVVDKIYENRNKSIVVARREEAAASNDQVLPGETDVAVKQIELDKPISDDDKKSVNRELEAMNYQHWNIVPFYGRVFNDGARVSIVMMRCHCNLRTLMNVWERFTEREASFFLGEICKGLKYLHQDRNVIHRDIKPENVLLLFTTVAKRSGLDSAELQRLRARPPGEIRVMIGDFDMARVCTTKPMTGNLGTTDYQASEMSSGASRTTEYTHSVDIFSAGILFMEMLTQNRRVNEVRLRETLCNGDVVALILSMTTDDANQRPPLERILEWVTTWMSAPVEQQLTGQMWAPGLATGQREDEEMRSLTMTSNAAGSSAQEQLGLARVGVGE